MSSKATACCPQCRLVHASAGRRCRHCRRQTLPLAQIVESARRRGLQSRTPRGRGWRWFDIVFAALAVLGPLQLERRHPRWFVPALLIVVGSWALFRGVVWLLSRYRVVWRAGPRTVAAVPSLQPQRKVREGARSGVARRLSETVAAHLVQRRCLAASLALQLREQPDRLRLRSSRAAPFMVEDGDDVFVVRGEIVLDGEASETAPLTEAAAALGVEALDQPWLDDAVLREVLLQNRNRVEVCGGTTMHERVAALAKRGRGDGLVAVFEGSARAPVYVTVR